MFISETTPYLEYVTAFAAAISALHFFLDVRQLKALKRPAPPAEVKDLYADDDFAKKQAYQLDKLRYGMLHSAWDTALNIYMLWKGYYPVTWALSGPLLAAVGLSSFSDSEIHRSMAWAVLLALIGTLLSMPWGVYSTFYLEARHGFNKTTLRTFIADTAKSLLLTLALMPPVVAGITYILMHTGPKVALYLWGFIFGLSLVMMTVYPTLIAPLFNKYDPLSDGTLRTKIEALAAGLGFPLKKLFVVDGSTRSAHSNAYMYGFFNNKRIVLYDTLLSQCSEEQVVAVLAHELGHWKLGHTPVLFVASQVLMAAQFTLFAATRGAPGLYSSFGFPTGQRPVLAALLIFQMLTGPLDEVLGLLQNVVSRKFEFQADAFAVAQGKGKDLVVALCTLDKENKGPPNVDALYSAYHFSHPPLPERLAAINAAVKKKK